MTKLGVPRHDPVPIGEEAKPPFARMPELGTIFEGRAARLKALAADHELKPYLDFLAGLCEVQHRIVAALPPVVAPDEAARTRAAEFGMPPIDRNAFVYDDVFKATLASLLAGAQAIAMPDMAREALARVTAADDSKREAIARTILADGAEVEFLADHVFVAAAVQVHFARLAAQLDPEKLVPVGDGACPTCGGAPAASVLVTWPQAHGTRFCACAHCGTMWNYVRIKCTLCGSTKGIAYQEIDGGNGAVKAETCEECGGYVKILNQAKDPGVEPIADDVASLGLDMLVHELGHRRGAFNPFLLGY